MAVCYIKCFSSGGVYIGIAKDYKRRMKQHEYDSKRLKLPVYDAMNMYSHTTLILSELDDYELIKEIEKIAIGLFNEYKVEVYNVTHSSLDTDSSVYAIPSRELKTEADKIVKKDKPTELEVLTLYRYLRKSNRINQYQQVALLGAYIDLDRTQELTEGGVLFAYCYKMLGFMHSFTNVLKRNQKTDIQSWTELYEMLEISNPTTRTKFKKFCLSNDIIRVNKVMRCKDNSKLYTQFIVNPFIFRKAKHVGQVALSRFGDVVIGGVNTDSYAVKYLEFSDILTPTHAWKS